MAFTKSLYYCKKGFIQEIYFRSLSGALSPEKRALFPGAHAPMTPMLPLPVWHTMLPKCPEDKIENVQKPAFRIIYPATDYEDALKIAQCKRLNDRRRQESCAKTRGVGSREPWRWGAATPPPPLFQFRGGLNVFAPPSFLTMVHNKGCRQNNLRYFDILLHLELCKSPSKVQEMAFQRL